jgi:hypothetical protein
MALLGLLIMSDGVRNLLMGRLEYPNSYRAAVFAPFAVVIGALAIVVAIVQGSGK